MNQLVGSRIKKFSPPMADDCSTKKVKFRAQGHDGDNPEHLSFRDMLMVSHQVAEGEWVAHEEELILDQEDCVVSSEEDIPPITFSQKVHAQLIKLW